MLYIATECGGAKPLYCLMHLVRQELVLGAKVGKFPLMGCEQAREYL